MALAHKRRADTGVRRAVSVKIREAIEGLALQKPPLPIATLYRQVQRFAQDLTERVPSYDRVADLKRQANRGLMPGPPDCVGQDICEGRFK